MPCTFLGTHSRRRVKSLLSSMYLLVRKKRHIANKYKKTLTLFNLLFKSCLFLCFGILKFFSNCHAKIFKKILMLIFERERKSESMSRGGAEREGDTDSKAGSRFWAVSTEPDAGLEPTNGEIMTWAEVGRLTVWATQVPLKEHKTERCLSVSFVLEWEHSDALG